MGEAAESDELLDDSLELVLLDGAVLGERPLLQNGGQLQARDRDCCDAVVQGVGERALGWMGGRRGSLGGRGEAAEQAAAGREEALHCGAGAPVWPEEIGRAHV